MSIASAVVEEEGTSAAVETAGGVIPQPIVDAADRQYAPAAAAVARMPQRRVVALLAAADHTAVAHRMGAAHRAVAANATSR